MKFDIEHLNHLAERLDYKPDSHQHKDNLAEYCNSDIMMAIAKAYRALERRAETAEAEVQRLKATAQPVSDGWVKCSERMPEDAQWCLVYTDYGQFAQCWSHNTNRGWLGDEISIPNIDATHWMPLPAAPGGQDDKT